MDITEIENLLKVGNLYYHVDKDSHVLIVFSQFLPYKNHLQRIWEGNNWTDSYKLNNAYYMRYKNVRVDDTEIVGLSVSYLLNEKTLSTYFELLEEETVDSNHVEERIRGIFKCRQNQQR